MPAAIAKGARLLAAGGLVAFPTETVYGLGADATNDAAITRLFAAKERPAFNPLIVHVPDLDAARLIAAFNEDAERLAAAFWPGPLTLVLPRAAGCPVGSLATAGLDTVAVRVPAHPVARALLEAFGKPLVAPSANRSGCVSPTTAEHVAADLAGRVDLILDGGPCGIGVESTVLACLDGITVLRPGAIPRLDFERILSRNLDAPKDARPPLKAVEKRPRDDPSMRCREQGEGAPLGPGMLALHYAPRASVRIDAISVASGEALLAFGPLPEDAGRARTILNLSESGNIVEAAQNLFAYLRRLDDTGVDTIAVAPIPQEGLGEAINDRLRRTAAPRSHLIPPPLGEVGRPKADRVGASPPDLDPNTIAESAGIRVSAPLPRRGRD